MARTDTPMRRSFSRLLTLPLVISTTAACAPTGGEGEGDAEDASFGGGKADGLLTDCERIEVVKLVNASTTDLALLQSTGSRSNAAQNILDHRAGPDGVYGTADDDRIDGLAELDAIAFVGPVTLDGLVDAIGDRCEIDIASRDVIDEATFGGAVGGGFARDNTELEAAMTVNGMTGAQLNAVLAGTDDDGRTGFEEVRRVRLMEAFTYGYSLDEIPWDSDEHAARESMPFVPLTIESGRFEPDPDDGGRELSLGTDINDDFYFDTLDYRLLAQDIGLRGRIRWDTADTVRRLLIAAKFDSAVGDDGVKRASKIDVRRDSSVGREDLVNDVRRGQVAWSGSDRFVEPIRAVYEAMAGADALETIDGRTGLLVIDPKAVVRSARSRYHLNLAAMSSLDTMFDNGADRIELVIETAEARLADPNLDAGLRADLEALVASATALLDKSEILARAEAGLLAIDPAMIVDADAIVLPSAFPSSVPTFEDLEKNRVIAEAFDAAYHAFGEQLDDIDRDLTGTRGLDFDDYVDMFVTWQKSQHPELRVKTTMRPFLQQWNDLQAAPEADRQAAWDELATFAADALADGDDDFEDFEAMNDEVWAALGAHLTFETIKISQRQIEAAGTVANAIWFDEARAFYVPGSFRPTGNFLIDTMDFSQMLTPEEWATIPEAHDRADAVLPPEKVFHAVLVNEVQIELGFEDEYLERIAELEARVADGSATSEDERALEGAKLVFGHFNDAMIEVAALKGEDVLDDLDDLGAPRDIEWAPSSASKGTMALQILTQSL